MLTEVENVHVATLFGLATFFSLLTLLSTAALFYFALLHV